jgi:hypothetical protein
MTYSLDNRSSVRSELLYEILRAAAPETGHILVLVGENNLGRGYVGVCVPRFVLDEARTPAFLARRNQAWDCGIALPEKTCGYAATHTAFFVQVLAHELGHARVALADPALHVYCAFIESHIVQLSNGAISLCHELPHEAAHDRFGLLIAEGLLGREPVQDDLRRLLADSTRPDRLRLDHTRSLTPGEGYAGLRAEVAEFARPYADLLCSRWSAEMKMVEAAGGPSLTRRAPHIEALFA